jgi:hypothetical protein
MEFTKKLLCELPFCYSVSQISRDGRPWILLAPDAPGPCYCFDSLNWERETVWTGPGGTMSMVAWPQGNGSFLAVQGFNPGFQAQKARLVYAFFNGQYWQVETLFELPYLHRFDILERANTKYLVCCTLCSEKMDESDWSSPGGIYVTPLPFQPQGPYQLIRVNGEMTRNHGYWRVKSGEITLALTACDQGVFEVMPPVRVDGSWGVRCVLERPVSDIALCDIDRDGVDELAAIEPFHGSEFVVYHKDGEKWAPFYRYPRKLEFLHVVWGGLLRGQPVFIGGCRGGQRELFLVNCRDGNLQAEIIDSGTGTSNINVINRPDSDLIIAANRESGQAVIYTVYDS